MINSIIHASLKNKTMVLIAMILLILAGIWSYIKTPLDAIPDLSDVQVIVFTQYPGQSPQVVEDQVTYPLTSSLMSVPKTKTVRGYSFFGYSIIYLIFEDDADIYWARSRVLESLNYASTLLPQGIHPSLGPDATGVGWIYEYALIDQTGQHDLAQLRSIQDWYLRYPLQDVTGVVEVASVGGFVKQYQVEVDPQALLAYNIPLSKVKTAIKRSNNDVGGRLVEMAETEYMVRGLGYIKSLNDLKNIPLSVDQNGIPIRLQDVAHIQIGPEMRRGLAELNGQGETVGGIVVMRFGENAMEVIRNVRKKLKELEKGLPKGVEINPVYDRGRLIEQAITTLKDAISAQLVVVTAIVVLFLLHLRSALVVVIVLPLGVLIAFIIMKWQGLNANIMSLGGIAIAMGDMVDGSIVMVENAHKNLAEAVKHKKRELTKRERWRVIGESSREVGPALFFSLLVITVSFFPILALEGQEGRLFSPLVYTKTYAMAAAAFLTITVVPVLISFFLHGRIIPEKKNPANRLLHFFHLPILKLAMRWRVLTLLVSLCLVLTIIIPFSKFGSEFMPPLDEGDILYMPTTFPGISITKAKELLQQTDKMLMKFPEVQHVFGKVGRAETATDTAPLSMLETLVSLKPRSEWPDPNKTTRQLIDEMDQSIQIPGLANSWTMPIKARIDMLSTGIKTPVGIKVSGPDLYQLEEISKKIELVIKDMPETLSVFGDRVVGGYYLDFDIDREEAARYGLTVSDIQDVIQTAIGGLNITETVEGLERYPINLRYPRELRDNFESLSKVFIPTPTGAQIPLAMVADLNLKRGPPTIKTENALPNAWVYIDLKTSDIGGFVEKAKKKLEHSIEIPPGYIVDWSGQYQFMERATKRLAVVIPITLFIIFLLLYYAFSRVTEPLIVMLTVPFGMIGGVWLTYWYGFNLSVAVMVGFIALAGTAVETGVLVLSFIDLEVNKLRSLKGRRLTSSEIKNATIVATSLRLRPVAITAFSTMAGLIPIMWSMGIGADVTLRVAIPVFGGMVTVIISTLLVFPVIYSLVLESQEKRQELNKIRH